MIDINLCSLCICTSYIASFDLSDHQLCEDDHQALVEGHQVHKDSHHSFVEGHQVHEGGHQVLVEDHQVHVEDHQVHVDGLLLYGEGHQVHIKGHQAHQDPIVLARGYLVHVGGRLFHRRKVQVLENHQPKHLQIQNQVLIVGRLVATVHTGQQVLHHYRLENHLLFVKNLPVHVGALVGVLAEVHAEDHLCKDLLYLVDHQGDLVLPKEGLIHEGHLFLKDVLVVLTEDQ